MLGRLRLVALMDADVLAQLVRTEKPLAAVRLGALLKSARRID